MHWFRTPNHDAITDAREEKIMIVKSTKTLHVTNDVSPEYLGIALILNAV